MAKRQTTLCRLQIFACLLGLAAGFVPGISFTGRFWGLGLAQDLSSFGHPEDAPVRVIDVQPGSPAYRSGFRVGDEIHKPPTIDDVRDAEIRMNQGEKLAFTVRRGEQVLAIESDGFPPQLAAVWYADPWHPIAGIIFLCIGVFVFATEPLEPAPLWRSIPLTVAGLGIAVGFGAAIALGSVFGAGACTNDGRWAPARNGTFNKG